MIGTSSKYHQDMIACRWAGLKTRAGACEGQVSLRGHGTHWDGAEASVRKCNQRALESKSREESVGRSPGALALRGTRTHTVSAGLLVCFILCSQSSPGPDMPSFCLGLLHLTQCLALAGALMNLLWFLDCISNVSIFPITSL